MAHNYFYGQQSEEYTFYRIPKVLFTDDKYKNICVEAKVLYGLMLDRMSLSRKNNWLDKYGRVYIMYSIEAIGQSMSCARQKVYKLLSELEKSDLIERKKLGQGKTSMIYVKSFIEPENGTYENHTQDSNKKPAEEKILPEKPKEKASEPEPPTACQTAPDVKPAYENHTTCSEHLKYARQKRKYKNPPVSQETRDKYRAILEENLEMDIVRQDHPDAEEPEELFDLILDTVCTSKDEIRICGDYKPTETVKSRFLKLTHEHMEYVLYRLNVNTSEIRNPKQYLLAMLWNAPLSMENHYTSMVNHDMSIL